MLASHQEGSQDGTAIGRVSIRRTITTSVDMPILLTVTTAMVFACGF